MRELIPDYRRATYKGQTYVIHREGEYYYGHVRGPKNTKLKEFNSTRFDVVESFLMACCASLEAQENIAEES